MRRRRQLRRKLLAVLEMAIRGRRESKKSPEPFEIAFKYLKYSALHNIEDDPNIQYIYILDVYVYNIYLYHIIYQLLVTISCPIFGCGLPDILDEAQDDRVAARHVLDEMRKARHVTTLWRWKFVASNLYYERPHFYGPNYIQFSCMWKFPPKSHGSKKGVFFILR